MHDPSTQTHGQAPASGDPGLTTNTGIQLLAFGFLLTFLSSFGQTFFIGLFSNELRGAAGLGDGAFGSLYSAATLASALCVFWAGALIDRVSLRAYVTAAAVLLALGCFLLTRAEQIGWLVLAFFLLRFAGQGLFTHTAVTALARRFATARGRALSIALLGHPVGEAVLPIAAVLIVAATGWRTVWLLAVGLIVVTLPLLLRLGRGMPARHSAMPPGAAGAQAPNQPGTASLRPDFSRAEVLRDRRFHLLVPTLVLPPFIVTGLFIHQTRLIVEKGWSLSWFALCFMIFAAAQVAGMLGAGPLIDRVTAKRLAPLYLLPLGAACIVVNLTDHALIAAPFMAGAGLSTGIAMTTVTALWAELYGVTHLGAIRALSVSLLILSTALAPALFGWSLELGVSFGTILLLCAAMIAIAALMARTALAPDAGNV